MMSVIIESEYLFEEYEKVIILRVGNLTIILTYLYIHVSVQRYRLH